MSHNKVFMFPSSVGMEPVNLRQQVSPVWGWLSTQNHTQWTTYSLFRRLNRRMDAMLPSSDGIGPESLFSRKNNSSSPAIIPKSVGIEPVNSLTFNHIFLILNKFPNVEGMVPVMPFSVMANSSRLVNLPSSVGREPVNLTQYVSVWMHQPLKQHIPMYHLLVVSRVEQLHSSQSTQFGG